MLLLPFATMFSKLSNLKNVHFFQQSEHFYKCRLLQDCCMGERVKASKQLKSKQAILQSKTYKKFGFQIEEKKNQ